MKAEVLLTRAAFACLMAALVGAAFGALALEMFAGFVAAFVLLTAVGDYVRQPQPVPVSLRRHSERMPLAA